MPLSILTALLVSGCLAPNLITMTSDVFPVSVTSPMNGSEDVADDACVWRNPSDPSKSLIIAINKSDFEHGGLYLFGLDGQRYQPIDQWAKGSNWFSAGKKLNNVDSRSGFPAGATTWDIICASNRTDRSLDVFRVVHRGEKPTTLVTVGQIPIGPGFAPETDAPYGVAIAKGGPEAIWSAFVSDKQGRVAQIELSFDPHGKPGRQIVGIRHDNSGRPWQISESDCPIEGIVADSDHKVVYIAAEDEGICRYQMHGGVLDVDSRIVVDRVGPRLTADVEGLTLYRHPKGGGYLIASSQGSNQFVMYHRDFKSNRPNQYSRSFTIGATKDFDAVQSTDGIDAVFGDFGGIFSRGIFVAHDGEGSSPTHYKIVPWSHIESTLSP